MLALTVTLGLAAAGATFVARAVMQEIRPLWLLYKPLSCDLCMNWWASCAGVIAAWEHVPQSPAAGVVLLGATGVGVIATKAASRLSD
jgi:hypothetical protein